MFRLLFIALLSLGFSSLVAQNDVVLTQLQNIGSTMADQGFNMVQQSEILWLDDDETKTLSVYLNSANRYQIWGVCDGDCSDLDLELVDVYGNQIDVDILEDDVPLLDPENPQTGTYNIRVKMHECSIEPCKVGIGFYAQASGGGVSNTPNRLLNENAIEEDGDSPQAVVDNELRSIENNLRNSGFDRFADTEYMWLNEDETKSLQIRLSSARAYQIWGACDGDCSDVDMELLDAYGNTVDEDILEDDRPLINPSNPQSGPYTLQVKMYECSVEPCLVGLTFFHQ
ncbi:MAG: hypothetical protein AAF433_08520 [Bacteroidota bacterium]